MVTKPNLTVSTNVHQHEQRNPKHGTVTGIVYKQNKNGASHPYVEVHWDNHSRVDLHAANRLWMEKDLKEKMADFSESLT